MRILTLQLIFTVSLTRLSVFWGESRSLRCLWLAAVAANGDLWPPELPIVDGPENSNIESFLLHQLFACAI